LSRDVVRAGCAILATVAVALAASGCGGKPKNACAVYAADGSAEVRFAGVGAAAECSALLKGVPPGNTTWTTDAVDALTGHRDVICRLSKPPLKVTILDTGLHAIGRPLCNAYASAGWS
jgi:hypothetical protein